MMRAWTMTALLFVLAGAVPAQDHEWGKGVTFTTSWDEAIRTVNETGKLLFIYNGWENKGI